MNKNNNVLVSYTNNMGKREARRYLDRALKHKARMIRKWNIEYVRKRIREER